MIISKYGIELHRVCHDDIELIRQMRNHCDIRSYMFEQEIITPEKQEAWFASINNVNNYYFVILYEKKKVGLIYGKHLDFEKHECEGGIFIWDRDVMGTDVPAKASICLTEMAFNIFLNERIYAKVRSDNPRAISYNKMLGYQPAPQKGSDYMVLTRANYEKRAAYFRRTAGAKDIFPLSSKEISISDTQRTTFLYEDMPRNVFLHLESCFKNILAMEK